MIEETDYIKEIFKLTEKTCANRVIKLINSNPFNINYRCSWLNGWTILMSACAYGQVDVVKDLIKHRKIDINMTSEIKGNTALHVASANGYIVCVTELLSARGVEINKSNFYGNTALYFASKEGYIDIVTLLLKYGANKNIKNFIGNSCKDVCKNDQIRKLLENVSKEKNLSFKELFEKVLFTDITISIVDKNCKESKVIRCHKIILSQSKYLLNKIRENEIIIEYNEVIVRHVLDWLYGCKPLINSKSLLKTYNLARKYELPELMNFVVNELMKVNPQDIFELIKNADRNSGFYLQCLHFVKLNQFKVFLDEKIKCIKDNNILIDFTRINFVKLQPIDSHEDLKTSRVPQPYILLQNYISLLCLEDQYKDFTLKSVENIEFKVHKSVVGRFEYFTEIFKLNNEDFVKLNITEMDLETIIRYLYTSELVIPNDIKNISRFLNIANKYKLFKLERSCVERITSLITSDNVIESLDYCCDILDKEENSNLKIAILKCFKNQSFERILEEIIQLKKNNKHLASALYE